MNKNIYILTNFNQYLKSFSPIIVVQGQIEMLKRAGYEPVLIVSDGWDVPEDSIFNSVRTERIMHPVIDGLEVDDQFTKEVNTIMEELNEILPDDAVVITHDLIFLPDYVKYNVAGHEIAKQRPGIQWLHWVHSATNPQQVIAERNMFGGKYKELLAEHFENSIICYPNSYDIPRVADNFGYEQDEIFEVPHPIDPIEGMAPIVKRLYNAKKLYEAEVLVVYPHRLDRGKFVEANVRYMKGCKDNNMTSHLVVCDFQSTGGDKEVYRNEMMALAEELGVADRVTFLSQFDASAVLEVPHQTILDLFTLSNIFLMPSKSETYSLITQEAMSRGNLCFLNQDFAPFRQIFGDNAIYTQFGGANIGMDGKNGEITTTHSNNDAYYKNLAINTKYWLLHDRTLRAKTWTRTHRNLDIIFHNYLEPLLTRKNENAQVLDSDTSL